MTEQNPKGKTTEGQTVKESGIRCRVEGCKRPYRAKGYCNVHYKKWRHGELPHPRFRTCSLEECHKKVFKKSLCEEHFRAKYPSLAPKPPEPEAAPPPPPPPAAPAEAPASQG